MQFLKILFWCLLAFVAAVFTVGNWTTVPIKLWGGLIAEVNLPLLLFVTFLLGLVPTMIYYNTVRWRLRNRLATSERTVTDLRGALSPAPAPVVVGDPGVEPPLEPAPVEQAPTLPLTPPPPPAPGHV
jgi:putative membrane protein